MHKSILEDHLNNDELEQVQRHKAALTQFIEQMKQLGRPIACVTSGGTAVPLQKKTVRLIENFSTGLRGSILAEKLLEAGWAVIFFYRDRSVLPFTHGLSLNEILLSKQPQKEMSRLTKALEQQQLNRFFILYLDFRTIFFYLYGSLIIKDLLPAGSIYILCAAVSDFVPEETPENKIHSSEKLELKLKGSPKILGQLVRKDVLTVSFKLETDDGKLKTRMAEAIQKYDVHLVAGNILNKRNKLFILGKDGFETTFEGECVEEQLIKLLVEANKKMRQE